MVDIIGYSALTLNLFSMTMKKVLHLRILAIGANSIYNLWIVLTCDAFHNRLYNCCNYSCLSCL